MSASISDAIATVNSAAPATSILRSRGSTRSCRNSTKPAAARAPIGRLIQNTHDQEMCCTMRAPASGPITDEMPHTEAR